MTLTDTKNTHFGLRRLRGYLRGYQCFIDLLSFFCVFGYFNLACLACRIVHALEENVKIMQFNYFILFYFMCIFSCSLCLRGYLRISGCALFKSSFPGLVLPSLRTGLSRCRSLLANQSFRSSTMYMSRSRN